MMSRTLGTSGIEVPVLSLGTWAMSGYVPAWGHVDDNESIATIHQALDLGIRFIDTAPIYGLGHSEEIVGKAIRGRRDECLVATKCGLLPGSRPDEPPHRCLRYESVLQECEASLRRMHLEVIDVYQCHWPDPETPIGETMEAMLKLREEGKIRTIGLSNFGCQQVASACGYGPVHALQIPFSMLHRQPATDLLPYCAQHGIGTLVYSPLAKGLLTGKFRQDSEITGVRASDPEFRGERFRRNLWTVAQLREIADGYDRTPAQLALNWVISEPGVTSAIVGAKRPSQIVENAGALGWEIREEDRAAMNRILEES